MPQVSFYGATQTVTGSRFLFETSGKKLLIDCGLFQGNKENRLRNWDSFPVSPAEIDCVFLTHAHIDHSGYLPRLNKYGFSGEIYCTYATRDLCDILLHDTAHLQEEDALWANKKGFSRHDPALPLFKISDVEETMRKFTPLYYGEDFYLADNLRIKFKDAGHILGSAFVDIKLQINGSTERVLFSGDLGRPDQPILRNPVQVFNVDYLILESTYGDRLHEPEDAAADLTRIINDSIDRGGVLLIPSFAVGRTQALLYTIRELEELGRIPSVPVYVDSPMAINATHIFEKHRGDYDLRAKVLEIRGKNLFHPQKIHFYTEREQSISINNIKNRAIIISASGMVTGGRILHHMEQRLPDRQNTILFIGFQAEGTRGRAILEGNETVKIHGKKIDIRANIEQISGFSAHADYNEILAWLMGFNRPPKKIFVVHGEKRASEALAEKIRNFMRTEVIIPQFGEQFDLA